MLMLFEFLIIFNHVLDFSKEQLRGGFHVSVLAKRYRYFLSCIPRDFAFKKNTIIIDSCILEQGA